MTDADEFLGADDVQEFRSSEEYGQAARALVVDLYAETRLNAESTLEEAEATTALKDALQELATESEDPPATIDAAKTAAGSAAQKLQEPRENIVGEIDDATEDLLDEYREEQINSEGLAVPEGVGLDEYLEDELTEIVRQQSTDAVDEPVLRWRFSDGVRIETSESVHHDWYALFKKLATATDKRLVPELASEQVEERLRDDEDTDGEAYARYSLGPQSRPWHTDNALWSRAISGLVQERIRTETVVGARTDAWESIQQRIRSGRAVRDLTDAVEHGMIHVDEDMSEVWVPTALVDNAADQLETSRRAIQAELAERELTSPTLSGERVSEAVSRGGTAMRFWRLDLTHDDVPEPEIVLDEIEDPLDAGADLGSDDGDSSAAAADGGSKPSHGTERFGRPADGADSAEDDADGTGRADGDEDGQGDDEPPNSAEDDASSGADSDEGGGGDEDDDPPDEASDSGGEA